MKQWLVIFFLIAHAGTITYQGYKCDIYKKNSYGYKVRWYVHKKKPYEVFYIRVKCPNGRKWYLENVRETTK